MLQLLTDLPRCVPQDISNATWAFATLRHHPGNTLMDAAAVNTLFNAFSCFDFHIHLAVPVPFLHPLHAAGGRRHTVEM